MTYLERIAAEPPADLIAEVAADFKRGIADVYSTVVWKHRSPAQARANRAKQDAVLDRLRTIWRHAHTGDPAWRQELTDFAAEYRNTNGISGACKRFQLIAKHSPAATPTAR